MDTLDKLVRENSAFVSFTDLINAHGSYRPSLECGSEEGFEDRIIIADAYDQAMKTMGYPKRAYRYGNGFLTKSDNE
jgi:hypothetical protein